MRARSAARCPGRRGSSFLEVQVAFAVLGVAMAGLAPVVLTQLRLTSRVEARLDPDAAHFLVPDAHPRSRKLGAAAARSTSDPGPRPDDPTPGAANVVELAGPPVPAPGLADAVVAVVIVTPAPDPEPEP